MPHPAVISKAEQKEEAVPSGSLALPCKASGCMSGVDTSSPSGSHSGTRDGRADEIQTLLGHHSHQAGDQQRCLMGQGVKTEAPGIKVGTLIPVRRCLLTPVL